MKSEKIQNQRFISLLWEAIGGEWEVTGKNAPIDGFTAVFPRFHVDAIVAVVNAAAEQSEARSRAIALADMEHAPQDPNSPRRVYIPRELVGNKHFQHELEAGMKSTIAGALSQQLSHSVGWGLSVR